MILVMIGCHKCAKDRKSNMNTQVHWVSRTTCHLFLSFLFLLTQDSIQNQMSKIKDDKSFQMSFNVLAFIETCVAISTK